MKARKPGECMYRSTIEAGYPQSMALNAGTKIENRPAGRRALDRWMDREGISDAALMAGSDDRTVI
jgi:hypothetical protein